MLTTQRADCILFEPVGGLSDLKCEPLSCRILPSRADRIEIQPRGIPRSIGGNDVMAARTTPETDDAIEPLAHQIKWFPNDHRQPPLRASAAQNWFPTQLRGQRAIMEHGLAAMSAPVACEFHCPQAVPFLPCLPTSCTRFVPHKVFIAAPSSSHAAASGKAWSPPLAP